MVEETVRFNRIGKHICRKDKGVRRERVDYELRVLRWCPYRHLDRVYVIII